MKDYLTLDAFRPAELGFDGASVVPGMLTAWCAQMQLFTVAFEQAHAQLLLQVRMREVTGAHLFIAAGGTLNRTVLNAAGQKFLDRYMDVFEEDVNTAFGSVTQVPKDDWDNYQKLARLITSRYMQPQRSNTGNWLRKLFSGSKKDA